jgi:hypothetical protein
VEDGNVILVNGPDVRIVGMAKQKLPLETEGKPEGLNRNPYYSVRCRHIKSGKVSHSLSYGTEQQARRYASSLAKEGRFEPLAIVLSFGA